MTPPTADELLVALDVLGALNWRALKPPGVSWERIAERAGVTLSSLYDWVGGRYQPRPHNLRAVLTAMKELAENR